MRTKTQDATVKFVYVKPVPVQVPVIVQHVIAEVPAIAKIKALLKRRAFK
jgi:hypothetical protein